MTFSRALLSLILIVPLAAQTPEPTAYVPNKTPVSGRTAERPRGQGHTETVAMLVIIDPTGKVATAEVLSGDSLFIPRALEDVKQWRYRPVIRDGQPVYAYTSASAIYWDTRGPKSHVTIGEEADAAQRRTALNRRFQRTVKQQLADLEQDRGDRITATEASLLAKTAVRAEAWDKAATYAKEALDFVVTKPTDDGQGIHDGHMVLGLVALHEGNVERAKQELLASGKTTGSPVLGSFGPNMSLAKALLEKGERDVVLQYFEECKQFWKLHPETLNAWSAAVRNGGLPNFGANLVY